MLTGQVQAGRAACMAGHQGAGHHLPLLKLWLSRPTTELPNTAEEPFHTVVTESFYTCKSDDAGLSLNTLPGP